MQDYRTWLQALSGAGTGANNREAQALLQVVGNDGGINKNFLSDPFGKGDGSYQTNGQGHIVVSADGQDYGYGPQGLSAANDALYTTYKNKMASGAQPTAPGSGTTDTTSSDLAYLDDQEGLLRGMLGSADKTLANGRTQIADSFNKELSRTNQSKSAATAKYNTEREDTTRSKQGAVDQVNTGARTLSDSVRRMLGMAAGTHSTAFQEAAPNMIARDATIKRSGVMDTYGKNFRDIDTAQNDTNLSFDQYLQDLADQRKEKESGLEQGVLQQKQQLNTNLGQIARDRASVQGGGYSAMRAASSPYQAAATNAQTALDGLFEKFRTPYQTKDVQVAAPNLRDYTVDRTALQANNGQGNPASPDSLYQQVLKKKFSDATA